MGKSVRGSCDHHGDSRTIKKRSATASSKLAAARGLGDQLDKSHQSNLTSKLPPVPVMKRKFQKTAEASPKTPSVYNLRSKDQKTDVSNDRPGYNLRIKDQKTDFSNDLPGYNLRSKVQKTEGQNSSTVAQKRKTPKQDGSNDSSVGTQKKVILKNSTAPVKKMEVTEPLTTSLASLDMKDEPMISQHQPYLHEPIYHIRWEGGDMENGPCGQNCMICHKDLSGVSEDDESEYNDDYQYEDDDDEEEYGYLDELTPTLLPAVDILPCGHAYHTECLQEEGTPVEHSNDPQCVLCSKKA